VNTANERPLAATDQAHAKFSVQRCVDAHQRDFLGKVGEKISDELAIVKRSRIAYNEASDGVMAIVGSKIAKFPRDDNQAKHEPAND
jgi:hypothetical protein